MYLRIRTGMEVNVNESEARRRQLLNETRNLYRDDGMIPAVHPRYRFAHNSLYPEDEELPKSSLKLRIVLSICLFLCYVALDYKQTTIAHIDSAVIRQQISYQLQPEDISGVLQNF